MFELPWLHYLDPPILTCSIQRILVDKLMNFITTSLLTLLVL